MNLRRGVPMLVLLATALLGVTGCAHLPFRGRGARSARVPVALAPSNTTPSANAAAEPAAGAAAAPVLPADEAGLMALIEREPHHAPALGALARLYYQQGRFAEGAEVLRPAAEAPQAFAAADRARLLAARALLHDALGERAEAREAIARARQADPRAANPTALYLELRKPGSAEAPALARDVAREHSRSGAEEAVALNNVGIARLRAGDVAGARRALESALALDPALPGPSYNLAILEHWWQRDRDAAARHFARYWRLSHDDPDGLAAVFREVVAEAARPEAGR